MPAMPAIGWARKTTVVRGYLHLANFLTTGLIFLTESSLAQHVETGVPGMIFERNVEVPMSDGLTLRANVYRPDQAGRFPVVMLHGPYGKDTRDADAPASDAWNKLVAGNPELCKTSSCRFIRWEAPDPEHWVADGYVVVHADSRGSNASPGMLDPFSPRQTEDYATLITWASRQPWSSGKIGLLGISYYAINQWRVAARQPEGLAAIVPWEGAFDHYRDIAYHGGIASTEFQKIWFARQILLNQHGNGEDTVCRRNLRPEDHGRALAAARARSQPHRADRGAPPAALRHGFLPRAHPDRRPHPGAPAVGRQLGRPGPAWARQHRRLSRRRQPAEVAAHPYR